MDQGHRERAFTEEWCVCVCVCVCINAYMYIHIYIYICSAFTEELSVHMVFGDAREACKRLDVQMSVLRIDILDE